MGLICGYLVCLCYLVRRGGPEDKHDGSPDFKTGMQFRVVQYNL